MHKTLITILLFISFLISISTFAYWANYVEGENTHIDGTITIGSADGVETLFTIDNTLHSGGLLVPSTQLLNSKLNSVDYINLTYTLQWLENNDILQTTGTLFSGFVGVSHTILIENNHGVVDYEQHQDLYDLINVQYAESNPATLDLNGDAKEYGFTITLDEPTSKEDYDLIQSSFITVVFSFNIMEDSSETSSSVNTDSLEDSIVEITTPYIEVLEGDEIYWELGNSYIDPGYIAYDTQGNQITNTWASGEYDMWTLGSYTLSYDCYSSVDNMACSTAYRTITVVDTTAPEIHMNNETVTLNSSMFRWITIEYMETYLTSSVWATDTSNDLSEITYQGFDTIDENTPGTYYIEFSVTDGSGNVGTGIRTVILK